MIFSCVYFECAQCGTHSDIYFEKEFDASEVKELCICSKCSRESYCNIGDLGYRNDLSDPDYPPWQAQIIRINPSAIYCDKCLTEKIKALSDVNLLATCGSCNKESMVSGKKEKVENRKLSDLLELFSKTNE